MHRRAGAALRRSGADSKLDNLSGQERKMIPKFIKIISCFAGHILGNLYDVYIYNYLIYSIITFFYFQALFNEIGPHALMQAS